MTASWQWRGLLGVAAFDGAALTGRLVWRSGFRGDLCRAQVAAGRRVASNEGVRMGGRMGYRSVLYLDDMRVPTAAGVDHVRSYGEFVQYLRTKGVPELISFDHDLAREHYPTGENRAGERIPYDDYREATGLHCARFVVENGLDLRFWAVHSANVQGRINIERELRAYRRRGEVRGLVIPFVMGEAVAGGRLRDATVLEKSGPEQKAFSATSLLQFDEAFERESWRSGLPERLRSKR